MKFSYDRILLFLKCGCFFLVILFFSPVFGEQGPGRTVVVKEGQNVRDLAQEYLGDPNLWMEILRANEMKSPADIRPQMTIKLPDNMIQKAQKQLQEAREAIDQASKAGAKVYVPDIIGSAIQLQNEAMAKRKAGEWEASFELARSAYEKAKNAVEQSANQTREAGGEAILVGRKGTVQSRKPSDLIWNDLSLNAVLAEGEKVRTLSESYAEIQFIKDNKQVRLTENSQIVISVSQAKVVKNEDAPTVSLTKGDAYLLLDGKEEKSVRQNAESGQDDGTASEKPMAEKLLSPPILISPENGANVLFGTEQNYIDLKWEGAEDASGYWLELATDRAFKHLIVNQKNLRETAFRQEQLKDGVYYWRLASMNRGGFPGTNSKVRFFKITNDSEPPYLVIHSPKPDDIISETPARITGEVESGASLSFEGNRVEISQDGQFKFEYPLKKGPNEIVLEARDRAGNVTRLSRSVLFSPNTDVAIRYDPALPRIAPGHFIAHYSGFTLKGQTEPGTAIEVRPENLEAGLAPGCFADDTGAFQVNLKLSAPKTRFTIMVTSPGGHVTRDEFIVELDSQSPEILLSRELPAVSDADKLKLRGKLSENSFVFLNDAPIQEEGSEFEKTISLQPGMNLIRLTARDYVGNISFLDRKVILDQSPPKLVRFDISPQAASGGETVRIRVFAEDESELKESAEFKIQVGEYVYTGFLKLNKFSQFYEGTVNLPKQAKGSIKLDYVKLSDYKGNTKTVNSEQ
jgi:hypothetical protein